MLLIAVTCDTRGVG